MSIPEYLRKINSSITFAGIVSVSVTFIVLLLILFMVKRGQLTTAAPLVYVKSDTKLAYGGAGTPFGSKNGKTYTYSWCGGASVIKEENKIYFKTEMEAKSTGRTLSKLCSRP